MKYSYFPGCSLEHNAEAYDQSFKAIAGPLEFELVDIDDWNCCGATEYISLNATAAFSIVARNLAQAAKNKETNQVLAPCSACYLNLSKTDKYLQADQRLAKRVAAALAAGGLSYQGGTLHVRHLLDVITQDVGVRALASHVVKPLKGLRLAPYYGCLISRPGLRVDEHNPEYPTSLDEILTALGAEVIDFPLKTHCCGGHMTQISEAVGFELIRRLIKGASDYRADLIVTVCPMCQLNLDAFQGAMNAYFKTDYAMPVLYFTQAIGLAFGLPADALGIGAELVNARPALTKIGVEVPAPAEAAGSGATTVAGTPRRRRDDKSLPMPAPLPAAAPKAATKNGRNGKAGKAGSGGKPAGGEGEATP